MRKRYSSGGIKKQRGRWVGMWWSGGGRKSRVLGFVNKMTKTQVNKTTKLKVKLAPGGGWAARIVP